MSGRSESYVQLLRSFPDSDKLNTVSEGAECLFLRLLAVTDDAGRYPADPGWVAAKVFTHRLISGTVTPDIVAERLGELERATLIALYDVQRKAYLQIVNLFRHNRSDVKPRLLYPAPEQQVATSIEGIDPSSEQTRNGHVAKAKRTRTGSGTNAGRTRNGHGPLSHHRTIKEPPPPKASSNHRTERDLVVVEFSSEGGNPETLDRNGHASTWDKASAALTAFGVAELSCLAAARKNGCSEAHVLELIAFASERRGQWQKPAGALHRRIQNATPERSVADHWPPTSAVETAEQRIEKSIAADQAEEKKSAAERAETQASLEQLERDQGWSLDELSDEPLAELIREKVPGGQMYIARYGLAGCRVQPAIRPKLLRELQSKGATSSVEPNSTTGGT